MINQKVCVNIDGDVRIVLSMVHPSANKLLLYKKLIIDIIKKKLTSFMVLRARLSKCSNMFCKTSRNFLKFFRFGTMSTASKSTGRPYLDKQADL